MDDQSSEEQEKAEEEIFLREKIKKLYAPRV